MKIIFLHRLGPFPCSMVDMRCEKLALDFKLNFRKLSILDLFRPLLYKSCLLFMVLGFLTEKRNSIYLCTTSHYGKIVGCMFFVPRMKNYLFMGYEDYQIGGVYVRDSYRGLGLADYMFKNGIKNIKCNNLWYLTNSDNFNSINLALKNGFHELFKGQSIRPKLFLGLLKIYKKIDLYE